MKGLTNRREMTKYGVCQHIYVTVNMCNQGIRVFPENFREYVYSLVLMTREYAYSLTRNC